MLLEAQARARLPNPARDFVEDVTEEDVLGLPRHDAEYRVDSTGARVSISSAKSLLFQYCSKLPSDWWAPSHCQILISGMEVQGGCSLSSALSELLSDSADCS